MNSEVRKFAEAYEMKMMKAGKEVRLNENELRFLDQVYGPEFGYNFSGLTPQLPFQDYRGGNRYIDFSYESGPIRILVEVDSLKYHAEGISHQQYDDHQERQNDMILNGGWILVRFTANMIRKNPMVCRRQLVQAVGKSLITSKRHLIANKEQLWQRRKHEIMLLATEAEPGCVKPAVLAIRFGIHRKTAAAWLKRMADNGELKPVRKKKLIVGYSAVST